MGSEAGAFLQRQDTPRTSPGPHSAQETIAIAGGPLQGSREAHMALRRLARPLLGATSASELPRVAVAGFLSSSSFLPPPGVRIPQQRGWWK